MLGRGSEWRQGNLLTDDSARALGLVEPHESNRRVVVISHDCDLQNDKETFVEVIVGRFLQKPDNMFAKARHPRELHLTLESEEGQKLHVAIRHTDKKQVGRDDFENAASWDASFDLPFNEKRSLKQWLAARYGRPAFPSTFEGRFRKKVGKDSVEKRVAKILEPASSHLIGLFFDLGDYRRADDLDSGDPYPLSISVVYDATEGGPAGREAAEKVARELRALFEEAYGCPDAATEIALESCEAVADTRMTLADIRKVDQWRLEYISLREDPSGDFLPLGEVPI